MQYRDNDSLLFTLNEKQRIIDSLRLREKNLTKFLTRYKNKKKLSEIKPML